MVRFIGGKLRFYLKKNTYIFVKVIHNLREVGFSQGILCLLGSMNADHGCHCEVSV